MNAKELDELANSRFTLNIETNKKKNERLKHDLRQLGYSDNFTDKVGDCLKNIVVALNKQGQYFIYSGHFCNNPLCFNCQKINYIKNSFNAKNAIKKVKKRYPDCEFILLTFQPKNAKNAIEIENSFDRMNKSIYNILRRKKLSKSYLGAIKAREITVSNKKQMSYNQHEHVLLAVRPCFFNKKNYVTKKQFQKWFKKNMKTKARVDMERVKPNYNHKGETLAQSASHVAQYMFKPFDIFKYVYKKVDNSRDHTKNYEKVMSNYREKKVINDLEIALSDKRMITYSGCFRTAKRHVELDKQILKKHKKAKNEHDIVKKIECKYIETLGKYVITHININKHTEYYPNEKIIETDKIRGSKQAVTVQDIKARELNIK